MEVEYKSVLLRWANHVAESGCLCGELMVSAGWTADVACCFCHWCPGHSKQVSCRFAGKIL